MDTMFHAGGRPLIVAGRAVYDESLDGIVVRWPPSEDAFDDESLKFAYVEVDGGDASSLQNSLPKIAAAGVIAARDPDFLVHVYLAEMDYRRVRLALRVSSEPDLAGLERCPYDAVEVPQSMATHDFIRRTHLHRCASTGWDDSIKSPGPFATPDTGRSRHTNHQQQLP